MDPHMMAITMECNVPYSILEQEEGTFGPGWTRREANASHDNTTHTDTWYRYVHRLVGLVVTVSAARAEDPGFQSCLHRDFSGLESYQ